MPGFDINRRRAFIFLEAGEKEADALTTDRHHSQGLEDTRCGKNQIFQNCLRVGFRVFAWRGVGAHCATPWRCAAVWIAAALSKFAT